MTISISDLPVDVTGSWHFKLRDHVNTALATAVLEGGQTVHPVPGSILRRFVVLMGSVQGAYRLDDGLCIGDVQGLTPEPPKVEAAAEPEKPVEKGRRK